MAVKQRILAPIALCVLLAAVVAPERAVAQQRISALIASGDNETDWRWTSTWLQSLLRGTGKFDVKVTLYPDGDLGDPGYLSQFQVVVLDYAGAALGDTAEQRFLQAVEGGLGVVVFGAAATTFPDWAAYRETTGLAAKGGAGSYEIFDVTLREVEHPLTVGLGAWKRHLDALPLGLGLAEGAKHELVAEAATGAGPVPVLVAGTRGEGRVVATPLGRVMPGDPQSQAALAGSAVPAGPDPRGGVGGDGGRRPDAPHRAQHAHARGPRGGLEAALRRLEHLRLARARRPGSARGRLGRRGARPCRTRPSSRRSWRRRA